MILRVSFSVYHTVVKYSKSLKIILYLFLELGQWFYLPGCCQTTEPFLLVKDTSINSSESSVSITTFPVGGSCCYRDHTQRPRTCTPEPVGGGIMRMGFIDFWILTKTSHQWQNNTSPTIVHPSLTTKRNTYQLWEYWNGRAGWWWWDRQDQRHALVPLVLSHRQRRRHCGPSAPSGWLNKW